MDYQTSRDPELKDLSPLRRYMDLPKFVDLLRSKAIYLRRADYFTDKFEGALTPAIRNAIDSVHASTKLAESADTVYQRCRMGTFVNCWTYGAKDNMALWQLFGGSNKSVAICTTAERLTRICLNWHDSKHIALVRYIDHFENPDMIISNYYDPLKFKHEAFNFEREVRVLLVKQDNWQENPIGIQRSIGDLDSLITSVVVAPEAESWFLDLVKDLSLKYGLKAPVRMSQLSSLPSLTYQLFESRRA